MLRLLSTLSATVLGALSLLASTSAADDLQVTLAQKNALLQDATKRYDTATISKLITSDFTLITTSAKLMDAKVLLADVGDRDVKWLNNDSEDVNVRAYNDDCAIVTAVLHQKFEYHGKLVDYRVRFTDTWVKMSGTWRYVAGHASMLAKT